MTGSHSSSQPDDVIGIKKVSWNLSPGSYRELQLEERSGAALDSLTPKQPTLCVQAPAPETQDVFATDKSNPRWRKINPHSW